MHDIGGLIWILLIIIGVVSSISKSARKAAGGNVPAARAGRVPAPAPPPPSPVQRPAFAVTPPPVVPPVLAPAPVVPPMPAARPPELHVPSPPRRRGLFANGNAIVRGIVAAEVLGKPKAERADDLW